MENSLELSVILPSYLEEENLRLLLPRLMTSLNKLAVSFEVLIVDTHEPMDNTRALCEQYGAKYVNRENGNFYGDAIRTGIKSAFGRYIIFMDADGSHPPEFIGTLFGYAYEYDVVIASRYVKGGATDNGSLLVFMSLTVNWLYSTVLNLKCKDVSNSFKLYDAKQLKSVALYCNNFDVVEEILYKISRKYNINIKEVPFSFKQRMFGHTKRNLINFMITFAVTLVRLRFGK